MLTGELTELRKQKVADLNKGTKPAQVIYIAAGLAEWDLHVTKKLSAETKAALKLMFGIQQNLELGVHRLLAASGIQCFSGSDCGSHGSGHGLGWLAGLKDEETKASVATLQKYLRETAPPNDYGSVVLLCLPRA